MVPRYPYIASANLVKHCELFVVLNFAFISFNAVVLTIFYLIKKKV